MSTHDSGCMSPSSYRVFDTQQSAAVPSSLQSHPCEVTHRNLSSPAKAIWIVLQTQLPASLKSAQNFIFLPPPLFNRRCLSVRNFVQKLPNGFA